LNKHTAHYNADGSVTIIVAKTNPAAVGINTPNWMNTCHRNEGTMCVRWIRAASHPTPHTKIVKLSQLSPSHTGEIS
jgi:hypothetical protein